MTTTVIDGGCVRIVEGSYSYMYEDSATIHQIVFTASQTPKVGDSIVDGVLVPLTGYKVVEDDNSRLRKRIREEWENDPDRR